MAADTKLIIRILTDAKDAAKGVQEARSGFSSFNDTMRGLAAPAGVALGAITALGAAALGSASELQQSQGAIAAVFGDSADTIERWSRQAADSVGLATSEYQNFASVIGAQLKNLGVPMDQVAGGTDELIRLGADLAATYGGSTQQAVEALSSALRGEADPAERYGLMLNQTAVNAWLAAQGMTGLEGEALTAAKAQAIMALATEQAGGALGQYEREADTVAGQQSRLNAKWEDAQAALGQALLPAITPVIEALADFAGWVQQNADWLTPLIAIIGALAGAVIAYTAVQWALNAAMTANPIGLVIAGVAALVAAFIWLWNNVEGFRNFFIGLWEGIQAVVGAVVAWFVSTWNAAMANFQDGWNQIAAFFAAVWAGIVAVVQAVVQWFVNAWNNAVNTVRIVILAFQLIFAQIAATIRGVVGTVAGFFANAWKAAVNTVTAVIRTLQNVFTSVFNAIMAPIRAVIGFFNQIVAAIQNVISWLGRIKIPDVFGAIGNLFGGGGGARSLAAPAPAAASFAAFGGRALALSAPAPAAMGGGGGQTVINVQGGLDSSDAIARRIQALLTGRDRRAHGVTIARAAR